MRARSSHLVSSKSELTARTEMASIYKRAARVAADEDMSDDSMTDASSSTIRADSEEDDDPASDSEEPKKPSSKLTDVPTELRNRILMLTSRGVSYR